MTDFNEKLNVFLTKTGLSMADYEKEFAVEAEKYTANGLEAPTEVIFRMIKGRYSTSMKSNAVWYEGYFIGIDKPVDWAKKTYEDDVLPTLEAYKQAYGDEWIAEAEKAGETNSRGQPIYHSGNTNQAWMYGKVIPETQPKRKLYAFLTNEQGEKNFTIVYTMNINGFLPVPGKMYKFRASKNKAADVWTINTTTVSKLQSVGGFVAYDDVVKDIDRFIEPTVRVFEKVYDVGAQAITINHAVPKAINFAVNLVMIAGYNIVDPAKSSVDFIELTDLAGDWDDNLPVTLDHGLEMNMAQESQGIAIWVPFFKKDKASGGKVPGGQLIGFILNEKVTPIVSPEMNNTTLESEADFE